MACSSILKKRGSTFLVKCWYLSTRHPGTQQTSYSRPWKPQISQFHSIFYIVTNVMCIMTFFIKTYDKLVVLHYPCCYSECNICLKSIEMLLWIINFHLQVLGIQTKFWHFLVRECGETFYWGWRHLKIEICIFKNCNCITKWKKHCCH